MATISSLTVLLQADTKQFQAGMAEASATTKATTGGMASAITKFGAGAQVAVAVAGVAVLKFASDAVQAASDLNESVNKVKVVFGSSSDEVIAWAKTMASSFGISEQAALESAGTFGNLFDAMGLASDAGQEMSQTLVEMAADLASFNNASPEDVLQALQSGLTGQIRPLRQFGIEISEAALKQEALAEGITKSTSDMTLAEKVQLRYALILKQTGNAQGDFARTSDGLANQQRILAAQMEDLQANIGTLLLPAVLDLVSAFNDLATVLIFVASGFKDFNEKTKEAALNTAKAELGVGGWFERMAGGVPVLGSVVNVLGAFSGGQKDAAEATSRTQEQLRSLDAVVPEVSDSFARLATHIPKVAKAFRDTRDALIGEIPALRGTADTYKDTFTLSPQELVHITASWAKIAKTIASDLRAIADSDLKPRMREAIAALPPEMRDAWVQGSEKQRAAIERSIQATFSVQDQMPQLARQALAGGTGVGVSLTQGLVRGIVSGSPAVDAAARNAVLKAIAAAKQAAAAESPSKKTAELGRDLIEGLRQGLLADTDKLLAAVDKVMGAIQDRLHSVLDKSSSFGQSIQSGFSSLLDISGAMEAMAAGTSPVDFFQQQLILAQRFAHVLKALRAQGAGKALLSAVAGQGPEAIPLAQTLLQGGPNDVAQANQAFTNIAKIADKTGDSLTNRFFGDKIADLRGVLVDIRDARQGINITVNGWVGSDADLAKKLRDELLKMKARNATTGL